MVKRKRKAKGLSFVNVIRDIPLFLLSIKRDCDRTETQHSPLDLSTPAPAERIFEYVRRITGVSGLTLLKPLSRRSRKGETHYPESPQDIIQYNMG
jgi:hypothetical protein